MAFTKTMIVLANSWKLGGRCVAGVDWYNRRWWIRPVSAREGGAVSGPERWYDTGGEPQLLDIVEVPLLEHRPEGHQTENWLFDPGIRWRKVGECADWAELASSLTTDVLWVNGYSSSANTDNRVPLSQIHRATDSLRLIRVPNLRVRVSPGRRNSRLDGAFVWKGVPYQCSVTDPRMQDWYGMQPFGDYDLGECFLTISLGEEFDDGYHYKLIAGVLQTEGGQAWTDDLPF